MNKLHAKFSAMIIVAIIISGAFTIPRVMDELANSSPVVQSAAVRNTSVYKKTNTASVPTTPFSTRPCYTFNNTLSYGSVGDEVFILQELLAPPSLVGVNSVSKSTATDRPGKFGSVTTAEVKAFQKQYGLTQTGSLGPLTRAKLNSLYSCNKTQTVVTPTTTKAVATGVSQSMAQAKVTSKTLGLGDLIESTFFTDFHRSSTNQYWTTPGLALEKTKINVDFTNGNLYGQTDTEHYANIKTLYHKEDALGCVTDLTFPGKNTYSCPPFSEKSYSPHFGEEGGIIGVANIALKIRLPNEIASRNWTEVDNYSSKEVLIISGNAGIGPKYVATIDYKVQPILPVTVGAVLNAHTDGLTTQGPLVDCKLISFPNVDEKNSELLPTNTPGRCAMKIIGTTDEQVNITPSYGAPFYTYYANAFAAATYADPAHQNPPNKANVSVGDSVSIDGSDIPFDDNPNIILTDSSGNMYAVDPSNITSIDASSYTFTVPANIPTGSYGLTIEGTGSFKSNAVPLKVTNLGEVFGCTDSSATNYNPNATQDNGSCTYGVLGCTNYFATNYNPDATVDDGSCVFDTAILGCTDPSAFNYNSAANKDDGSCVLRVWGCTDISATNYNSSANTDDGSCTYGPPVVLAPTITSLSPSNGPIGTVVIVTGTGFGTSNTVIGLNGTQTSQSTDGTHLSFTVPTTASPNQYGVVITNNDAKLTSQTYNYFTVTPRGTTPTTTPTTTQSVGIISGSLYSANEDQASAGTFSAGYGSNSNMPYDWHMKAAVVVNGSAVSLNNITFKHNAYGEGWSTGNTSQNFGGGYVTPYPLVTYVNGSKVTTSYNQSIFLPVGTSTLDLYGQLESQIFYGGTLTLNVSGGSPATYTVPSSSIRPTTGQTSTTTTTTPVNQPPVITSINPSSGAPGNSITITGSNFGSTARVIIGSASVNVSSNGSSLSFTVPSTLTGGSYGVQVTNLSTNMTSNSVSFNLTGVSVPTLTFSAAQSTVNSGVGTTLTWSAANVDQCYGHNNGGDSLAVWGDGPQIPKSGSVNTGAITHNVNFNINCTTSLGGGATQNVLVMVNTGTPQPPTTPTAPVSVSASASLSDTNSDKVGAGIWTPGRGAVSGIANDWHWNLNISASNLGATDQKTVQSIVVYSSTAYGEGWSTSASNQNDLGIQLYPLKVISGGHEATAYDQNLGITLTASNPSASADLYGQIETQSFSNGGRATITFTDGTKTTATIPGASPAINPITMNNGFGYTANASSIWDLIMGLFR